MDEVLLVLFIMDAAFFISWCVMSIIHKRFHISEEQRKNLFELVKYVTFAIVGYYAGTGGVRLS